MSESSVVSFTSVAENVHGWCRATELKEQNRKPRYLAADCLRTFFINTKYTLLQYGD